jgi:carboxyl-terminal processing protease
MIDVRAIIGASRRRAGPIAMALVLLVGRPRPAFAQGSYEQLQAFSAVLNYVRLNYVDSVTYQGMVRSAIAGMLQALDPHSRLETRADFERYQELMRGRLASSGMTLELVDGRPTVLAAVHDSPADRAGVLAGDRVLSINDTTVAGIRPHDLELRLSGDKGAKFRLELERGPLLEPDTLGVSFKLAPVKPPAVSQALFVDSNTALVRLESFERPDAIAEVTKTLDDLKRQGMRRLILDLRWNPGGLVPNASALAALFLPANSLVFRTVGREPSANQRFVTDEPGKYLDLPMAVVVNEWTASAAEAFAGAMQDHDRALIVGRRTFGKALMQRNFILPDGDIIWLTVARILSPSGRVIQRNYQGLGALQYDLLAGQGGAGADTAAVYHTDAGRVVRGGGGILPDSVLPPAPVPPRWWAAARDSGILVQVADSVAQTLGSSDRDRIAWVALGVEGWRAQLLPTFLAKCHAELGVDAKVSDPQGDLITIQLAARAAQVRWSNVAASALEASADPDILAARRALLAHPRP